MPSPVRYGASPTGRSTAQGMVLGVLCSSRARAGFSCSKIASSLQLFIRKPSASQRFRSASHSRMAWSRPHTRRNSRLHSLGKVADPTPRMPVGLAPGIGSLLFFAYKTCQSQFAVEERGRSSVETVGLAVRASSEPIFDCLSRSARRPAREPRRSEGAAAAFACAPCPLPWPPLLRQERRGQARLRLVRPTR